MVRPRHRRYQARRVPHDVCVPTTTADTVIVLGAGASQADGIPIQNALMKRFWQLASHPRRLHGPGGAPALRKDVIEPLRQFFQAVVGISKDALTDQSTVFPTFEEAFAVLDFAVAREEELPEFDRHWIADRRVNLANLIALTLIHPGKSVSSDTLAPPDGTRARGTAREYRVRQLQL